MKRQTMTSHPMNSLMRSKLIIPCLSLFVFSFGLIISIQALAAPSNESEVRSVVQRVFNQLKDGNYDSLYDSLPSSSQSRISRDRLVSGLQRTRNLYQLQRLEIGAIHVSGDLAVVDTVMFAHVAAPFDADGKLVVQQYLVKENGAWRIATGDRATIDRFLKNNPDFARKFSI